MFLLEKSSRAQLRATASGGKLVTAAPSAVAMTAQFGKSGAGGADYAWQAMVRRLDRQDQSYKN
jgi:hypothetical protein